MENKNETEVVVKRVSFGVTIDGVRHAMNKPNLKMLKQFTAKQKTLEKEDDEFAVIDSSIKFLANLGMPEEVVEGLDPQMIETVIGIVTGQKKS